MAEHPFTVIEKASHNWPRLHEHSRKVRCPNCSSTGYPGGSWTHRHLHHVACPECGETFSLAGLPIHRASHRRNWRNRGRPSTT